MIGELFGGLIAVVAEGFRPVVRALETVVGVVAKCGSYVADKTAEFIRKIDPYCEGLCQSIEEAGKFLNDVGDYLLGIARDLDIPELQNCSNEELGAKVLMSETRKREADEPASKYIEYLNSVELDKKIFENWEPEKRIASVAVGNALVSEAIKERTGVEIPVDFAVNMKKAEVRHEEVAALIENFSKEGKENASEINAVFTNDPNITEEKSEEIESLAKEALIEVNPEMDDEAASARIKDIKIAVQSNLPSGDMQNR